MGIPKHILEAGDHYNNYLGLNLDDPVQKAVNHAFFASKHLTERGKKTTVRKYEQKIDKLTEDALQLSETLKSLRREYRDCLMFSLCNQHDIPISNSDSIDYFIQSLAKAAQAVKEVKLKPISTGFYNAFIFKVVDNLLADHLSGDLNAYFTVYLDLEKIEPTENAAKKFLLDFWETRDYSKRIRETAANVILTKLSSSSKDMRVALKAVDKHLVAIVSERIDNKSKLLINQHNEIKDYESKLSQGNN